jgi:hypothetical protein
LAPGFPERDAAGEEGGADGGIEDAQDGVGNTAPPEEDPGGHHDGDKEPGLDREESPQAVAVAAPDHSGRVLFGQAAEDESALEGARGDSEHGQDERPGEADGETPDKAEGQEPQADDGPQARGREQVGPGFGRGLQALGQPPQPAGFRYVLVL